MKANPIFFLLAALAVSAGVRAQSIYPDGYEPESCTSIMVGRLASTDGSVITSHTCDGVSHTWITMEPAADHKKGDVFEVYKGLRHTKFKGDTTGVRKVGEIPEVRHTYAYVNTGYPCLNEKQLAMGESTFTGPDTLINKDAMFLIEELARLALMRCDNARDAIRLMGETAEKYGYGDTGECLTVADTKEVWAFEIVGCGRDKVGAVWVAQRVPDDEVSISCNIPRIGKIDRKDKDHFMASDNVEAVAKEYGLWDGEGDFVWFKAYNSRKDKKNFAIRDWFVFNTLAPSLGLSMDDSSIPFSIKPEHKVSAREVFKLLRGTYEGTQYDMCKDWKMVNAKGDTLVSPVANPWLVADTRNTLNTIAPGTIEFVRTLAVCWCSYSTVLQLRGWLQPCREPAHPDLRRRHRAPGGLRQLRPEAVCPGLRPVDLPPSEPPGHRRLAKEQGRLREAHPRDGGHRFRRLARPGEESVPDGPERLHRADLRAVRQTLERTGGKALDQTRTRILGRALGVSAPIRYICKLNKHLYYGKDSR